MAPFRTYSRPKRARVNSLDVGNVLNLKTVSKSKNKKKNKNLKYEIKDLPQRTDLLLKDESNLHVFFNDTFDKLLQKPNNSQSVKKLKTSCISNNKSRQSLRYNLRSSKSPKGFHISKDSWFEQTTPSGFGITNSLEIEIVKPVKTHNGQYNSHSYSNYPKSPIFLNSTQEHSILVHSSTPMVQQTKQKLMEATISPVIREKFHNSLEQTFPESQKIDDIDSKAISLQVSHSQNVFKESVMKSNNLIVSKDEFEQFCDKFSHISMAQVEPINYVTSRKQKQRLSLTEKVPEQILSYEENSSDKIQEILSGKSIQMNFCSLEQITVNYSHSIEEKFSNASSQLKSYTSEQILYNETQEGNTSYNIEEIPNQLESDFSAQIIDNSDNEGVITGILLNSQESSKHRHSYSVEMILNSSNEENSSSNCQENHFENSVDMKSSSSEKNLSCYPKEGNCLSSIQETIFRTSNQERSYSSKQFPDYSFTEDKTDCIQENEISNQPISCSSRDISNNTVDRESKNNASILSGDCQQICDSGDSLNTPSLKETNITLNKATRKSTLTQKVLTFQENAEDLSSDNDNVFLEDSNAANVSSIAPLTRKTIMVAGKGWRRSVMQHRQSLLDFTKQNRKRFTYNIFPAQNQCHSPRSRTLLENYATSVCEESKIELPSLELSIHRPSDKEVVLKYCNQTEPQAFNELCSKLLSSDCRKIGEGVYGEVYMYSNGKSDIVLKIIPIEGDQLVNGEPQKKFGEVLPEIVITSELSKLRSNHSNKTSTFCELKRISCVQGKYPEFLIKLWNEYDRRKGSENECPNFFCANQLYIVFELDNGGENLEAFKFNNALQAISAFKQTAYALAVAEEALSFEHRDLHWGNVLIKKTNKKKATFKHNGSSKSCLIHNVVVTIIDYTLSRITHDGVYIFTDLANDLDLFSGEGDYQFQVYRLMKEHNKNDWKVFKPFSNILWLHYLLDKSINGFRYKNIESKTHKTAIDLLNGYKSAIVNCTSASHFVKEHLS
ncbi:hypothetical protein ABEB36_003182 [Hypothenemus hampei]|uniref:non-specific serine/threonine protein kinase n=1 Tax=Hypothenemus hampei TaxID=57062 RepID=A0ABD1FBG6_HYPHA